MTIGISIEDLISESNSVQWNRNWSKDVQPSNHSVSEYLEIARNFRIQSLLVAKAILEKAPHGIIKDDKQPVGYYSLTGHTVDGLKTKPIDVLIAELEKNDAVSKKINALRASIEVARHNKDTAGFKTLSEELATFNGFIPDNRFLKSPESAYRKLPDYEAKGTQHPERIGDYLRFQILFDSAEDLAIARHALQFGDIAPVTSQKDKLRFPDADSGHRSFMAHIQLTDDIGQSFKFETMLSLIKAETLGIDKTFRQSERTSIEMAKGFGSRQAGLSNAFFSAAGVLEQLRKIALIDLYTEQDGMDALLDESVNIHATRAMATSTVHFNIASCEHILKKLPTVRNRFPELFEGHNFH